jgi:uncharacterized protein with PIN domain
MAYDAEPGGDPRARCPKCGTPIRQGEKSTLMHFAEDPYGKRGLSGRAWHSECARPYWDKLTPVLDMLQRLGG